METKIFQPTTVEEAYGWGTKSEYGMSGTDVGPAGDILITPTVDLDDPAIVDWIVTQWKNAIGANSPYDIKATNDFVITFNGFSGGDSFTGVHRFDEAQVYFDYTGGVNFNEPEGITEIVRADGSRETLNLGGVAFGTSFNGATDGEATFSLQVDIDDNHFFIYHWWSFGWGQFEDLTATLYDADNNELASATYNFHIDMQDELGLVGDAAANNLFVSFTSVIDVQGSAEGDYLIVENKGTNTGWRGTAVATERFDAFTPMWKVDPVLGYVYQFTQNPDIYYSPQLGFYQSVSEDWIYQYLHGYFYLGQASDLQAGDFLYHPGEYGWVYTKLWTNGAFESSPFDGSGVLNFFTAPEN